jgi:hypothetical protein
MSVLLRPLAIKLRISISRPVSLPVISVAGRVCWLEACCNIFPATAGSTYVLPAAVPLNLKGWPWHTGFSARAVSWTKITLPSRSTVFTLILPTLISTKGQDQGISTKTRCVFDGMVPALPLFLARRPVSCHLYSLLAVSFSRWFHGPTGFAGLPMTMAP